MPTYQYKCRDCGNDLEVVQAFSEDSLTVCPACSGSLRKVFSAVGISFKGSGFYKTDSRSSSTAGIPPTGSSGTSDSSSDSGSASATKSDSASTKSDSASTKSDSASTKSEPSKSSTSTNASSSD